MRDTIRAFCESMYIIGLTGLALLLCYSLIPVITMPYDSMPIKCERYNYTFTYVYEEYLLYGKTPNVSREISKKNVNYIVNKHIEQKFMFPYRLAPSLNFMKMINCDMVFSSDMVSSCNGSEVSYEWNKLMLVLTSIQVKHDIMYYYDDRCCPELRTQIKKLHSMLLITRENMKNGNCELYYNNTRNNEIGNFSRRLLEVINDSDNVTSIIKSFMENEIYT
jgi:hypothetical protein